MGPPIADDDYLLLFTLAVTVVFQLAFFVVAFTFKFDKVRYVLREFPRFTGADFVLRLLEFLDL